MTVSFVLIRGRSALACGIGGPSGWDLLWTADSFVFIHVWVIFSAGAGPALPLSEGTVAALFFVAETTSRVLI
ncbi:hypothetical protein D1159_16815 [Pseudoflavonifractor sp. 524-17]|nr:hypothetical protein [Pseudoflavonifractor sp. 524-17]